MQLKRAPVKRVPLDKPHVWADAISTSMYLGVIGAVTSLVGASLAWTNRAGVVAAR